MIAMSLIEDDWRLEVFEFELTKKLDFDLIFLKLKKWLKFEFDTDSVGKLVDRLSELGFNFWVL